MKTIYIDSDFKCHVTNDGTMSAVETDYFDDKCQTFIEGYRFVPEGQTWTRSDGEIFYGEMVSPWKPFDELDTAQREYERQLLAEYESALAEIEKALGVQHMTIEERKQAILAKIEEMKAEGIDMKAALEKVGVDDDE